MQGRRKDEFLAFGEHSILSDEGLLFSNFAQMMKGGFWLHLEEVLKCKFITEKKSSKTQPACPSKPKMLSKLHFKGFFFSFACLQGLGRPIKKAGMNTAVIKKQKLGVLSTVFSAGVWYSKPCINLIKTR